MQGKAPCKIFVLIQEGINEFGIEGKFNGNQDGFPSYSIKCHVISITTKGRVSSKSSGIKILYSQVSEMQIWWRWETRVNK